MIFTGGTVTGSTNFTNGVTANTYTVNQLYGLTAQTAQTVNLELTDQYEYTLTVYVFAVTPLVKFVEPVTVPPYLLYYGLFRLVTCSIKVTSDCLYHSWTKCKASPPK